MFATGYKSSANLWLKVFELCLMSSFVIHVMREGLRISPYHFFRMAQADDKGMVNSDGRPNTCRPNIWKGENGLYFSGFRRMGLAGICMDAYNIANEIVSVY